jgi:hypothetical protein
MLTATTLKNAALVAAVVASFLAAAGAASAAPPVTTFADDSFTIALPEGLRFEGAAGALMLRVRDVGNGDAIHILLAPEKREAMTERCAHGESITLVEADGSSTADVDACVLGSKGAPYVELWTPDFRITGNAVDMSDAYRLVGVLDQIRKAVKVHKPEEPVVAAR